MGNLMALRRSLLFSSTVEPFWFFDGGVINGVSWIELAHTNNSGTMSVGSTITLTNSSTSTVSNPRRASFCTAAKYNLTGYRKLKMIWRSPQTSTSARLYAVIYDSKNVNETTYIAGKYSAPSSTANASSTIELDISGYNGDYYIGGFWYKPSGSGSTWTCYVDEIWIE